MKKRLDQHLVDLGLAPSKTKAQELIELGQTIVISKKTQQKESVKRAAKMYDDQLFEFELLERNLLKYVARSGFKLEGALRHLGLDVTGLKVLDVGQSTGGFTDCLLQLGAKQVVGIDVGKNQLDARIANDQRVEYFEELNAKDLGLGGLQLPVFNHQQFDLVVIDVSFISLTKILQPVLFRLKKRGQLLALVKPQFEVGIVHIARGGIVKNQSVLKELEKNMLQFAVSVGLIETQYFTSEIKGRDGNQEYFVYGIKGS